MHEAFYKNANSRFPNSVGTQQIAKPSYAHCTFWACQHLKPCIIEKLPPNQFAAGQFNEVAVKITPKASSSA